MYLIVIYITPCIIKDNCNQASSPCNFTSQTSEADSIHQLSSHYDTLSQQTTRRQEVCDAAIAARRVFEEHMRQQEKCVAECEAEMEGVKERGGTVTQKLECYKVGLHIGPILDDRLNEKLLKP